MRFDEIIPSFGMGDMVPFDATDNKPSKVRYCSRCDARLSRYNPESHCSPCRAKEQQVIAESLDEIFG